MEVCGIQQPSYQSPSRAACSRTHEHVGGRPPTRRGSRYPIPKTRAGSAGGLNRHVLPRIYRPCSASRSGDSASMPHDGVWPWIAKQLAGGAGWPWTMKPGSPRISLTNDRNGITPEEVRDLWILCFGDELPQEKLDTKRIRKALQHSFSIQAMFLDDKQPGPSSSPPPDAGNGTDQKMRKLIGFARTESDGVFTAVVRDLCIHPDHQGAKLGTRLLESLIKHTRSRGVGGLTVFVASPERPFFKACGFNLNPRYRILDFDTASLFGNSETSDGGPTSGDGDVATDKKKADDR